MANIIIFQTKYCFGLQREGQRNAEKRRKEKKDVLVI